MFNNYFEHVTVEPSFFIFLTIYDWLKGIDTNLFLQKACRFNLTTEPDLNTRCDDEKRGILFVSQVNFKYASMVIFFSLLTSIFATTWSDKAGRRRRPLIYISILGQILQSLSGCLNSYFWSWTPLAAVLSGALFESISGGVSLMIMACQVYVCDKYSIENRTMRLGLIGAIRLICLILGRGGSGLILHSFGFLYSYSICLAFSVLGFIMALVFIKDTSVPVEKKIPFYRIFNLKRIFFDNFVVMFNKNLGRKRIIILLLVIANIAVVFTLFGELSVMYPYLRYRFGWDEQMYSYFMFYKFSGSAVGILFCSFVLSKYLKIHDGLIGILAGSFDTVAIIALLLANQIWQLYLIPLIDLFHGTAMTIGISFVSKYYRTDELGRVNAASGVFGLLITLSFPAYNTIFQKTLDTFPSAFCLLSAAIDVVIVLCFCGSYFLSRKLDEQKSAVVNPSISQ